MSNGSLTTTHKRLLVQTMQESQRMMSRGCPENVQRTVNVEKQQHQATFYDKRKNKGRLADDI